MDDKEKEIYLHLFDLILNDIKNDETKETLTDAYYYSFAWHFKTQKRWLTIDLKQNGLVNEIEDIDQILALKSDDLKVNWYNNILKQYMYHFMTTSPEVVAALMLRFVKHKLSINQMRKWLKAILPIRKQLKNPEEFVKNVEQEVNDLGKINEPKLKRRMNNLLSGTPSKGDERLIILFDALNKYKVFLKNELTINKLSDDNRIHSLQDEKDVLEYFILLTQNNNEEREFLGKQILSEDHVRFLMKMLFDFRVKKLIEHGFQLNANCSQLTLKYFIYQFYRKEKGLGSTVNQKEYYKTLMVLFKNFENETEKTFIKSMSRKPKKYPIKH